MALMKVVYWTKTKNLWTAQCYVKCSRMSVLKIAHMHITSWLFTCSMHQATQLFNFTSPLSFGSSCRSAAYWAHKGILTLSSCFPENKLFNTCVPEFYSQVSPQMQTQLSGSWTCISMVKHAESIVHNLMVLAGLFAVSGIASKVYSRYVTSIMQMSFIFPGEQTVSWHLYNTCQLLLALLELDNRQASAWNAANYTSWKLCSFAAFSS